MIFILGAVGQALCQRIIFIDENEVNRAGCLPQKLYKREGTAKTSSYNGYDRCGFHTVSSRFIDAVEYQR